MNNYTQTYNEQGIETQRLNASKGVFKDNEGLFIVVSDSHYIIISQKNNFRSRPYVLPFRIHSSLSWKVFGNNQGECSEMSRLVDQSVSNTTEFGLSLQPYAFEDLYNALLLQTGGKYGKFPQVLLLLLERPTPNDIVTLSTVGLVSGLRPVISHKSFSAPFSVFSSEYIGMVIKNEMEILPSDVGQFLQSAIVEYQNLEGELVEGPENFKDFFFEVEIFNRSTGEITMQNHTFSKDTSQYERLSDSSDFYFFYKF